MNRLFQIIIAVAAFYFWKKHKERVFVWLLVIDIAALMVAGWNYAARYVFKMSGLAILISDGVSIIAGMLLFACLGLVAVRFLNRKEIK